MDKFKEIEIYSDVDFSMITTIALRLYNGISATYVEGIIDLDLPQRGPLTLLHDAIVAAAKSLLPSGDWAFYRDGSKPILFDSRPSQKHQASFKTYTSDFTVPLEYLGRDPEGPASASFNIYPNQAFPAIMTLDGIIKDVGFNATQSAAGGSLTTVSATAKEVAFEVMDVSPEKLAQFKDTWLAGGPAFIKLTYDSGAVIETPCWFAQTESLSNFNSLYIDLPDASGERYNLHFTLGVERFNV